MNSGHSTRIAVAVALQAGLLCMAAGGEVASEPFEVGQRWVYQHEGPRPGSIEPNAIDGEKILQVISVFEEEGEKQWVIEERFTADPNVVGRFFVGPDRLLSGLEIENEKNEVGRLTYDLAVPYQVLELEVGAEKTIETTLRMDSADFALPTTIVIERLADETVETPAGRFVDCQHYKMTTRSTINIKIAKIRTTEERWRWYHPTVNGLVKEVYRKSPVKFLTWSKPGYTATSVLTAFDIAEVESTFDPNRPASPAGPSQEKSTDWKPLGGLVLLTAATLILVRQVRAKSRKAST